MTDVKREPLPIQFNMGTNLMASVAPRQNSTADEEIAPEADEPSDNCNRSLLPGKLQQEENMYKKQIVGPSRSHKGDSLLTRAIISDSEPHSAESTSIYTRVGFRVPKRGMSTTSTISSTSMPSTADLTSDASDSSSSELSSPSPRLGPVFALPLIHTESKHQVAIKGHSDDELHKSPVQADPNTVVAALGRKRCITFACQTPISRQNSDKSAVLKLEEPIPVRRTTLKFACNVKDECKAPKKPHSPPPMHKLHRSPVLDISAHHRRDSASTIVDERKGAIACKPSHLAHSVSSASSVPRFYEFASSVDESVESWMNAPQFPSRLLKADCLLEKERQIRKLSEEVDDEVADEEQADDVDEYVDDEEEDDGYKEDEEDDEYEMWSDSDEDNGSDDEDATPDSDDEDEDLYVPVRAGTSIPDRQADRPTCCRNTSDSSLASIHHSRKPGLCSFQRENRASARQIRPSTPELPDSTDFVPGTFDEDKALEDFYLACVEERKAKIIRPQDIDPSFPTEDNDDEDDEEEEERPTRVSRRRGSNVRHSSHSRSPRGSPAPTRRLRSPPPISRRGSRGMSPNRRRPSFTARSPPPQGRAGRLRFEFNTNRSSIARSTSLPRNGLCSRKKHCFGGVTSTSPRPSKAVPLRQRGALDIVKGLEKKRMRRREHIYGRREYRAEAGEGVEKMREIGMMGRERLGANAPPKFVISV